MQLPGRIRRTSDNLYSAWNAHDPDAVVASYTEDVRTLDVTSGVTTVGREAIRAMAVARFLAFDDFSVERLTLVIDGAASSDEWVMRGTHTGHHHGLPPTGNILEVTGATFSEYNGDGLTASHAHYVDVPSLLRQLGVD